jgi:pimeloyl-ACP methyl ester carboxylesterase
MAEIDRDGVRLGFDDVGKGESVVLVHGWGCNRMFFKPQVDALSAHHRVISLDLRGHGTSDAPEQDYTMQMFANDISWLCGKLDVHKPIVVGHSMGGTAVLELAALYPDVVKGIVLIDSLLFPPASFVDQLKPVAEALYTDDYRAILRQVAGALFIASDDPARKEWILSAMESTPQHVLASAFANHVTEYDASDAAVRCRVPAAYIGAARPLGDVAKLKIKCHEVLISQTLGAGHFLTLEAPDQLNAMLMRFISLCLCAPVLAYRR